MLLHMEAQNAVLREARRLSDKTEEQIEEKLREWREYSRCGPSTPNDIEILLNEHDVARITGMSVATVRRWRLLRIGPAWVKIQSSVRYRPSAVADWLASLPVGGGTR